jgi:peptide/nickel transport system permease protein
VFAQLLYGARISLAVGLAASAIALVIGIVVGAPAGYFGGVVDDALMRITELFQVIPRLFLAILLVALFGQTLLVTTTAIGVLSWPPSARLLRAEFLSKRNAEYVLAARAVGARSLRIIFREILPNTLAPLVVAASLNVGGAILLEAGLAFLGLSDPNQVSLGRSLQGAMPFIQIAWWVSFFPGLLIAVLVVAVNLIGDGVNDLLNPRRSH